MPERALTRFSNRWQPQAQLHIESGTLAAGPAPSGWLSAQWFVEPVQPGPNSLHFRLRNLWKPDHCLHVESGVPEAGPIEPGMLSAQWALEPVADAAFVRLRNRWPLVRHAHVESGRLDVGRIAPGWLSAHWSIERVSGTAFVRLRNRWQPEQCLHIESGRIEAGAAGPGWLSAQWSVEKVAGTPFVRLRNRWQPAQCFHIESGTPEAGPAAPGWLSAQWLLEKVAGTSFVLLRNRWEVEPYLHLERGVPEIGLVEPGWLSAQWLTGSFKRRTIPLALFQRRLDEWVNERESPLFRFRVDDNKFSVLVENPLTQQLETWREPTSLGHLEVPFSGNNITIHDLNTERVTVQMTSDPGDGTAEVEAVVRFETRGNEIEINKMLDVNLTGAKVKVRLRFGFDARSGTVDLTSFLPLVDAAVARAKVSGNVAEVDFRGRHVRFESPLEGANVVRAFLRAKLLEDFVLTDLSLNVGGVPSGRVADFLERKFDGGILDGLSELFADGVGGGWGPWESVSEGGTIPGAPMSAVALGSGRMALFVADSAGGIYTASRSEKGVWSAWSNVSEGLTTPGGHVTALALGDGRVALFLADPAGGVYTARGSAGGGWSGWTTVSEGSTRPGAPLAAIPLSNGRAALFLADPAGGVYAAVCSPQGRWGGWKLVPGARTTPGGHVTAVDNGDGRTALFIANANGGVLTTVGHPDQTWAPWTGVSEGSTLPGAPLSAVALGSGRLELFLVDPNGGVYTARRSNSTSGWSTWTSVSEGSSRPGARVTAVADRNGRVSLFVADAGGAVYTTYADAGQVFGEWKPVSEGGSIPGGFVAAAIVTQIERTTSLPYFIEVDRVTLAVADVKGGVYASRDVVFKPGINRRLTRLLVGGDHRLLALTTDAQSLTVDYLVFDHLSPFPEVQRPNLEPGKLAGIDHIVVLMMENRSFDHMLGYLGKHGGRADIEGLQESDPALPTKLNRHEGATHLPFALGDTQFPVSPCHNFVCVDRQIKGEGTGEGEEKAPMGGFVADFAERAAKAAKKGVPVVASDIMGYYQAAQVPVYDALAREFLVCDHWFCSHPGGTFPNRFYATTGRLDREVHGRPEVNNGRPAEPSVSKMVFDHLSERGVSWRYYEHGYGFARLFDRWRFDDTNVVGIADDERGFFTAARDGTLPSVSYIDPDFIEVPPGNDDHAPSDIGSGQNLVGRIVNALMDGPLWPTTLLLVTYDEHGGFYDHLLPPTAAPVSGIERLGVRVPALVVSPWVDRGAVSTTEFDHTSIIKTICRRFLGQNQPDLGDRVAAAADLSTVLLDAARSDRPAIPQPPAPAVNGRFAWAPWASVSEGSTRPGAPISAVVTGPGQLSIFLADPAGGVYTAARSGGGAWSGWSTVSEGSTEPGGSVTALALADGRIVLALADAAGGVYATQSIAAGGWEAWRPVSEGSTVPGAPIGAAVTGPGRLALFVADRAGGVYAAERDPAGAWGPWLSVSEGATTPGGHVTAVATGEGRVALFLADPAGGVYATTGSPKRGWAPWHSVSEGRTTPGAAIAAVVTGPGRIVLVVADPAGGIYAAAAQSVGQWGPWVSVSQGSTTPGGRVTALGIDRGRVALFAADPSGLVYTTAGSPAEGWGPWGRVSNGRTVPGGAIAAAVVPEARQSPAQVFLSPYDGMVLAAPNADGRVVSSHTLATLDGDGDDFHELRRAARYSFFLP